MRRPAAVLAGATCLALLLTPSVGAGGKDKPYNAQITHTFVNEEELPAQGLHVSLSGHAIVVTEDETGQAGPFGNIRGNGTGSIVLTSPEAPVVPGDEVRLTFRSQKGKLKIAKWWWVDEKGKPVGEKKKG